MDLGRSKGGIEGTTLDDESRSFLEQFGGQEEEVPQERAGESPGDLVPDAVLPPLLTCKHCGDTFEYSGNGRKPDYCEDHRTAKSRTEPKAPVNLAKAKEPVGKHLDLRLRRIAAGVEENILLLGAGIVFIMPTTGTIICRDAEKISENLIKLCKKHPKLIEALETANQAAPGLMLGRSVATIAVAAMVDMNRINQEEVMKGNVQIANMLGVAKVFNELHSMQDNNNIVVPTAPQAAFL